MPIIVLKKPLHNLLRSPNTVLRSTLALPPRLDLQVESAASACSHTALNPDYALAYLFDMSRSLRAVRLVFGLLVTVMQRF